MHEVRSQETRTGTPTFSVLGVRVFGIQIDDTVAQIESWIRTRERGRFIAFAGMHGVSEAQQDPHLREILNAADLVVPDGMPLVWLARLHGIALKRRVYGPELMETFCRETGSRYRHFFYGGAPGVAQHLARSLQERFGITVASACTPPFRALTEEEEREVVVCVQDTAPDVLWVGLSTPKQERWMYEHRRKLAVPVMLGVGAAFDLNCGRLRRAPKWMRENGLEWFFRLLVEPRRLWKRYLVTIPNSFWSVLLELLRLKKFDRRSRRNNKLT